MKFFSVAYNALIASWAGLLNRHEIAAEYWLRVAELQPRDAKAFASAAHHKAAGTSTLEAIALLRKAVDVDPKFVAAWFNLGFLLQKQDEHLQALDAFDKAILQDEKLDRGHYGRALSLIALNRHEEAKAALNRTIDLQPMSPYGYYQLAALHHRLGDEKACVKLVRQLSSFEPALAVQLQKETGVKAGVVDPMDYYRS